jgi:hypothetical protein
MQQQTVSWVDWRLHHPFPQLTFEITVLQIESFGKSSDVNIALNTVEMCVTVLILK